MTYKIQGEQPFQVLASNFSIGPSNEGYTLQISADGRNYSDLFSVGADVTRMVTGVANGSYYRLSGNNSLVTVNWNKQCSDGQGGGGGGSTYILPPATDRTLGGVKVGNGLSVTSDGTLSAEGGDSHILKSVSVFPESAETGDVVALSSETGESITFNVSDVVFGEGEDILEIGGDGLHTLTANAFHDAENQVDVLKLTNSLNEEYLVEDGSSAMLPASTDDELIWTWKADLNNGVVTIKLYDDDNETYLPLSTSNISLNVCDAKVNGTFVGGVYQYDGSSWNEIGGKPYRIELSTSNPDEFTQEDIANLNAFHTAALADPSIVDGAYIANAGEIYRLNGYDIDENAVSYYDFALGYVGFTKDIYLEFENGETSAQVYEWNGNCLFTGDFPADPEEGMIANYNDGNGNIGLYRYDGTDWVPFGGGDKTILKASSSMPSGASVGDVYSIHSDSSSTQTWTSDITTGFTQFRVPLNATSECSLQGFHMGGDPYTTDLWWHGEDDPKRWDMRGTATNWEVINLNTEFTYTANTNTITAAIDGDYVVVTLSQPVTEYSDFGGIEIMNEVIIPEKNDVYQVANKNAYDVTTTLIDSRIDGSTTLAKGVKIEINTPPSADTIVTNIEYFGSYFYFHVLTDGSVQIKDGKYDEVVVTAAEGDSGTANTGPAANYDYTNVVFTLTFVGGDEVAWENTIEHIGDMRTITYGEKLAKESDIPVIDDSRLLPENPNESAMPIYSSQNGWVTTNRDAVFTDGMYAFQNNWLDDGQHYVMTRDGYWDINWTPSYKMVKLTQTEYDNMSSHDSNTLYIIIPDTNVGA